MKTFKHIKNLPLEVSFQQVEQWVMNYENPSDKNKNWLQKLVDFFNPKSLKS